MFAVTGGEMAIVVFLFALAWGAGLLPRLGEKLGASLRARRGGGGRGG
jgi:Sec-independent protein translocase protein TatA